MYNGIRHKRKQKGREVMADVLFAQSGKKKIYNISRIRSCVFHVWLVAMNDFLLQFRAGFFESQLTLGIHFSFIKVFFTAIFCTV